MKLKGKTKTNATTKSSDDGECEGDAASEVDAAAENGQVKMMLKVKQAQNGNWKTSMDALVLKLLLACIEDAKRKSRDDIKGKISDPEGLNPDSVTGRVLAALNRLNELEDAGRIRFNATTCDA